jgi:putative N-acetyltransferase (TIGR04045 family)
MRVLYEKASEIVVDAGMSWRDVPAGCGRCEACSGMADFEDALFEESRGLVCMRVLRPHEVERCREIRHRVFVDEQRIFAKTDMDDIEDKAIHIFCRKRQEIIGTVRVHKDENGTFWGSRLAVLPDERGADAGKALVRAAEDTVKRIGGEQIRGLIQKDQVKLFLKLGWRKHGKEFSHLGRNHQVMVSPKLL